MTACPAEKAESFCAKSICNNKQKLGRETEKRHRRYVSFEGVPWISPATSRMIFAEEKNILIWRHHKQS